LDQNIFEKLDEKFNNFRKVLMKNLMGMPTWGVPEQNHCIALHIEPHQEENSNSRLFNHSQPFSGPHNN